MEREQNVTPLLMVLMVLICSIIGGSIMFWLAFAICAMLLIFRNYSISNEKQGVYLGVLLIHIAALVYQMTGHSLPMSGGDWGIYVWRAQRILERTDSVFGIFNLFDSNLVGDLYERFCAFLYYSFGYNQRYMYAVSFVAGEIVYYGIYKIALIITNDHKYKAILASLFFYITPLEIVYSVDFLREMVLQAIVINACYHFFSYIYSNDVLQLMWSVLLSVLASLAHSGYVGLIVAFIACFFLEDKQRLDFRFSPGRIVALLVAVVLLYVSPAWTYIASRFSNISSLTDLAEASSSSYTGMANTTYIGTPGSSLGVILQTPLRFFYYLVSPLPWQVRSVGTFIAMLLDATIRWLIFYRFTILIIHREAVKSLGNSRALLFHASLIIILITSLIFSWGTSNYGTAMRHRTSLYPIEIIIAFILWKEIIDNDSEKNEIYSNNKYIKS